MNATIGYSSMGYYFEDIRFNMVVFSHLATGFIRYGLIDPTARDYAASFNAHSDIRLYEMPGKRLSGTCNRPGTRLPKLQWTATPTEM
jgi:hypothetical protein